MAKTVKDVLDKKGDDVATTGPAVGVLEAAKRMQELKIGALIVVDGPEIVGVFTERDILNKVLAADLDPREVKVGEVMTSPVTCISPDAPLHACPVVMTEKRIRHLPVVEDQRLIGIITSGDVLAHEVATRDETIDLLYEYIHAW